jgi:rhodanese-related sulfurtransferase
MACSGQTDAPMTAMGSSTQRGQGAVKELAPSQLAAMLGSPAVFVYDCNEPEVRAEAHVPGAKPIVYDELAADKLPTDHDVAIIFYCYSPECPAASSAASTAVRLGFHNVYCMTAGITGWQDAGLRTEP